MANQNDVFFKEKYLKYKNKYLELQKLGKQDGGKYVWSAGRHVLFFECETGDTMDTKFNTLKFSPTTNVKYESVNTSSSQIIASATDINKSAKDSLWYWSIGKIYVVKDDDNVDKKAFETTCLLSKYEKFHDVYGAVRILNPISSFKDVNTTVNFIVETIEQIKLKSNNNKKWMGLVINVGFITSAIELVVKEI